MISQARKHIWDESEDTTQIWLKLKLTDFSIMWEIFDEFREKHQIKPKLSCWLDYFDETKQQEQQTKGNYIEYSSRNE